MTPAQYKNAKAALIFLLQPSTKAKYGRKYSHDCFNTCCFGVLFHAKHIQHPDVNYNSSNNTFGAPLNFIPNADIISTELFGQELYKKVFSGGSDVLDARPGTLQFNKAVKLFKEVVNDYEAGNGLELTTAPTAPTPLTALTAPTPVTSKAARAHKGLMQLHTTLTALTAAQRKRYGITVEAIAQLKDDMDFIAPLI